MKSPLEIAQKYVAAGEAKAKLPLTNLLLLGILAGAFIALGAFGSSVASCNVACDAASRMMSALVFPIGLTTVVVTGAELFTGNCLLIIPVLAGRMKFTSMLRNWLFSYIGNFIGSLIIVLLICFSRSCMMYGGLLADGMVALALSKVKLGFAEAFLRAILCNIMVCAAVWMSFATDDLAGKVPAIFLPIALFVLGGFEHCVANMYFIPAGIIASGLFNIPAEGLSWSALFLKNLLPVTLGNIAGGSIFIGVLFWFLNLRKAE